MLKFSEYVHSLFVPTNLNIVKIKPLRGSALFVFDPSLVFTIVDTYFGGTGRFHNKVEGREFTATEMRVIRAGSGFQRFKKSLGAGSWCGF